MPNSRGVVLILFGLLAVVAAVVTDHNEAEIIAAACLLPLIAAALTRWATSLPFVRVEVHHGRVTLGEDVHVVLRAHNGDRRSSLPLAVVVSMGEARTRVRLPALPPGGVCSVTGRLPTARRGRHTVGLAAPSLSDVVLRPRRLAQGAGVECIVHPRPTVPSRLPNITTQDVTARGRRDRDADDLAFTIRRLMPGDDARLVHWPSSIRTGTFMVRTPPPSQPTATVLLVTRTGIEEPGRGAPADFEGAVSLAAGFLVSWHRRGMDVELVVAGGPDVRRTWDLVGVGAPWHGLDVLADIVPEAIGTAPGARHAPLRPGPGRTATVAVLPGPAARAFPGQLGWTVGAVVVAGSLGGAR